MFFITNTDSVINLEDCNFSYGSKLFLSAQGTSQWGNSESNGGVVTLNLKNQNIEGDFFADSISGITISLVNSQIKGNFNSANTAAKLAINLDKDSSITLTGNSYYTSIINKVTTGKNINNGSFSFTKSEEKEISRNSGNQGGNPFNNNGNPPIGSGNPPNGSGNPPSGNPPNGSGNTLNGSGNSPSGNPPNGSGNPPSGNPPNRSGNPPSDNSPNGSGNLPNGNGFGEYGNNTRSKEDEDEEIIRKYFSNQCNLYVSFLLFIIILL